ncbi:MAG: M15 family metallopeptidase [Faecalibacterium sp.]|nr:M15 family metallopeptidase [Ruminococcus sp.]MCM1391513.1 M15 family metallopeptidase [Ruminococcus sp.]MCM1485501.1 M15 family metallopeptidase [Faecalibacterium sp.]
MKKKGKRKSKFLIYVVVIALAAIVMLTTAKRLPEFISEATTAVSKSSESTVNEIPQGDTETDNLVLVNSKHAFKSVPADLVSVFDNKTQSYFVKDKNVCVQKRVMQPLNQMMDDFYKATGLKTVNIISGYRSVESQEAIYQRNVKNHGKEYAKKFVQTPGYSEHHTGLAIDLALYYRNDGSSGDFTGEGEYSWFYENSWKYGFVRRYDEEKQDITGIGYEPWHFRYVGEKNAKYMYEHNLCLEEYVEN